MPILVKFISMVRSWVGFLYSILEPHIPRCEGCNRGKWLLGNKGPQILTGHKVHRLNFKLFENFNQGYRNWKRSKRCVQAIGFAIRCQNWESRVYCVQLWLLIFTQKANRFLWYLNWYLLLCPRRSARRKSPTEKIGSAAQWKSVNREGNKACLRLVEYIII